MAGAGYKLFNTGDVLTAAQVNTYLQEQAVMRFASAAARTTALSGVLAEGMVSYLMDTNAVEVYDGSAWVGVATGDITAVTAGTGISGGGTSGAVTITNSMATEITAAGDIIVGTGSGTFDNLPIGTTGQVLTADTTVSPYKVKWATAAGGGKVLQVVTGTYNTETSVTTSTYTDIGFTVSITPSATSSKVLAFFTGVGRNAGSTDDQQGGARLVRGSTAIWTQDRWQTSYTPGNSGWAQNQPLALTYLDSPATTSSTTYKIQICAHSGTYVSNQGGFNGSTLTLFEIGA